MELRPLSYEEVSDKAMEYMDKVWIVRHETLQYKIDSGDIALVDGDTKDLDHSKFISKKNWDGAIQARNKMIEEYGLEHEVEGNLLEKTDWEYGYISGKLAAFREIIGEGEDVLDT